MKEKRVKDLMIPIGEYAAVHHDSTLGEAIITLLNAQENNPPNREQIRAVLVVDDCGNIIGKIGHMAFIRSLEPKYGTLKDIEKLTNANLSPEFIDSIMDNFKLWQDDFYDICSKAQSLKAKDIMHSITESIDENGSLIEAMHKLIMWNSLSLLVARKGRISGIIRLSDIFNELASHIRDTCDRQTGKSI